MSLPNQKSAVKTELEIGNENHIAVDLEIDSKNCVAADSKIACLHRCRFKNCMLASLQIQKAAVKTAALLIQKSAANIACLSIQKSEAKDYVAAD